MDIRKIKKLIDLMIESERLKLKKVINQSL